MTLARDLDVVPARCLSCTWLGAPRQPVEESNCPNCNALVSPLRQMQFTRDQRVAECERLERFFESIGRPL